MSVNGKRLRTDEGLPLARGTRVARKQAVGLQAELAAERGQDLALVSAGAWENCPAEQGLDVELRIEQLRSGV